MFKGNTKIEQSVNIINAIEEGKFSLLLNRIVQSLSVGTSSKPFKTSEKEKLENYLEISRSEVQCLIDGIIEIFETCIYHIVKPPTLGQLLENDLSIHSKKSEIFVQVWMSSARALVDSYKQRHCFPQLSHLSYSLSVQGASHASSHDRVPKAQLQLVLDSYLNKRKDINLEFNGEQLYEFYKKLEQMQGQLDAFH